MGDKGKKVNTKMTAIKKRGNLVLRACSRCPKSSMMGPWQSVCDACERKAKK